MRGQTIILASLAHRERAKRLVDLAPDGAVVNVAEAKRTLDQNALMWTLLSELSRAKPQGRLMTPERWKAAFMQSLGHAVQFENDLDGRPFPIGHSSSRLNKQQMSDLIEFILSWGAQNGVRWTEQRIAA